jgi:hypothetical protein
MTANQDAITAPSTIQTAFPVSTVKPLFVNPGILSLAVIAITKSTANTIVASILVMIVNIKEMIVAGCEARNREKKRDRRDVPAATMCRMRTTRRPRRTVWIRERDSPTRLRNASGISTS